MWARPACSGDSWVGPGRSSNSVSRSSLTALMRKSLSRNTEPRSMRRWILFGAGSRLLLVGCGSGSRAKSTAATNPLTPEVPEAGYGLTHKCSRQAGAGQRSWRAVGSSRPSSKGFDLCGMCRSRSKPHQNPKTLGSKDVQRSSRGARDAHTSSGAEAAGVSELRRVAREGRDPTP
jgi:hypothetical protein